MGTLGRMPGTPAGFPPMGGTFTQRYGLGRSRAEKRRNLQPHPMDLLSGEFEKRATIERLIDLDDRENDMRVFGPVLVDGTEKPKRPMRWCAADSLFIRLMVITRLDRSRCDEDV